MTGKETPAKRFWRVFIAQVIGSVDFVTILKPVEIKDMLIIKEADIMNATIVDGMLTFKWAPKK